MRKRGVGSRARAPLVLIVFRFGGQCEEYRSPSVSNVHKGITQDIHV